jgi:hypothetical protein
MWIKYWFKCFDYDNKFENFVNKVSERTKYVVEVVSYIKNVKLNLVNFKYIGVDNS